MGEIWIEGRSRPCCGWSLAQERGGPLPGRMGGSEQISSSLKIVPVVDDDVGMI